MKPQFNEAGEMTVGKAIGVMVFVVVGLALIPVMMESINAGGNATANQTNYPNQAAPHAMIPIIGIIFVVALLLGTVFYVIREVRSE